VAFVLVVVLMISAAARSWTSPVERLPVALTIDPAVHRISALASASRRAAKVQASLVFRHQRVP
jgi:hypothetical protein